MSIKYFADRVRETSITTGSGNIVLAGPTVGYYGFVNTIGSNNKLTYYIYRQDTNFEWEIGVGYVFDSGGVNILVRERAISSSNNNNIVNFTAGTKYVETIVSEERINAGLLNVSEQSGNFTPDYISALYVIDASTTGVQVSLPEVVNENYPVVLSFVLNKTIGNQYSQPNAIVLSASGVETIDGQSSIDISVRDDYLQIMSVPSQSGWILLDPIQDSSNPYGNDGSIQVKYDSAFSGVPNFNWDFINASLLIGGTGTITGADVIIPASGGNQTVVFNEQSYANDLRIEGTGNTHLFFVDGSENKIAINSTNANDSLVINAQYGKGLNIYRSGVGPQITIGNTSVSGAATNDIIGSILFSGLNNSGNTVEYSKIFTTVEDVSDGYESANINMEIVKNGSLESVAVFGVSGVSLGFNNSNIDGIVIGEVCQNEGNNVVLGYYQNICGANSVAIGHNSSLASGSFGGLIGLDHSSSGNNIWILGGSGVSVTGNNKTYLAIDNNNYVTIDKTGSLIYSTYTSGNQSFNLYDTYLLTSGIYQNINFIFNNSTGSAKTGLVLGSQIVDPTNLSEDTRIIGKILDNGNQIDILSIDANRVNIGSNNISGNNIVFGVDCYVSGSNNSVFGSGIYSSGINNIIVGSNISNSGSNTVIVGKDVTCESSGNLGISIFGNNNSADEDYVSIFGNSNSASGLHAVAMGYLNGVHGEYSIGVGESNLILTDGSVAVGNSNSLYGSSIDAVGYAFGIGNYANISNTGLIVGFDNELYGSGGIVIGNNCSVSGSNNLIIGNNVSYTGSNAVFISGVSPAIYGNTSISGSYTTITGTVSGILQSNNNHKIVVTPNLLSLNGPSGIYGSGNSVELQANSNNKLQIQSASISVLSDSNVDLRVNNNNQIDIYATGVTIIGSGITEYVDNNNLITIKSTGLYAAGSRVTSVVDNNNYIDISNTGIIIKGSSINFPTPPSFNNVSISGVTFTGSITETLVPLGSSGTSKTISINNGTIITCTLTGNCVFTMPTVFAGRGFSLYLTQSGAFTASFTGVKWAGGVPPIITTIASRVDILTFVSDGTYWYGTITQNFA